MGQCSTKEQDLVANSNSSNNNKSRNHGNKRSQKQSSSRPPRMIVVTSEDGPVVGARGRKQVRQQSPSESTFETHPETPTFPQRGGKRSGFQEGETEDDDEDECFEMSNLEYNQMPSMSVNQVIPEEVDPDAPSDEEEAYQLVVQEAASGAPKPKPWELEPGRIVMSPTGNSHVVSPPRSQSAIKLMNKRMTTPSSIVHHDTTTTTTTTSPLIAPPHGTTPPTTTSSKKSARSTTSVDRQTLATFNKLRVQAELAVVQDKAKRRATKLEDRYEDVVGYRKLWNEYENIQETVRTTPNHKSKPLRRTRSFDLKNTTSWYFDFQSLDGLDGDDDDDDDNDFDNKSQASLSLLSAASMESQRRLYAEKSRQRQQKLQRRNSEPGPVAATIRSESGAPFTLDRIIGLSPSFDWDNSSQITMDSDTSRQQPPPPPPHGTSAPSSPAGSVFRRKGGGGDEAPASPVSPPKVYLTTDFPMDRRGKENLIAGTPFLIPDEKDDNDYHVQRRHRQYSFDQDKSASALEERSLANGLGIRRHKTDAAMSMSRVKTTKKELVARQKENSSPNGSPGISQMTTEEFLKYSQQALANIKKSRSSTTEQGGMDGKRLDFTTDAKVPDGDDDDDNTEALKVADEVASQVDEILQRFRE